MRGGGKSRLWGLADSTDGLRLEALRMGGDGLLCGVEYGEGEREAETERPACLDGGASSSFGRCDGADAAASGPREAVGRDATDDPESELEPESE